MAKVESIVNRHRDAASEELHEQVEENITQAMHAAAVEEFGAIRAITSLGKFLSANAFRGLQKWLEDGKYRSYGFPDITHFLNEHPNSPMSKNQYYDRLAVLEKEGDDGYDFFNSLKVPISARKLLSQGDVEIEGDIARIGKEEINLNDKGRIREALLLLAKEQQKQARTIETGKKDIDKYKRQISELEKRVAQQNPNETESGKALLETAGMLSKLKLTLTEATQEEREALRDVVMDLLCQAQLDLSQVYGAPKAPVRDDDLDLSADEVTDMVEN